MDVCPKIEQREIEMALIVPSKGLKRNSIRKGLKEYTYLGCPMTKNRSAWCFRMCKPNANGSGFCGREAPHRFKSRIQQGIEDFKKRQADSTALPRHHSSPCRKDT